MSLLGRTKIASQCAEAERDMISAFQVARKGAQLAHRDLALLSRREARNLRAVNPRSQRIWNDAFATTVIDRLIDHKSEETRADVFLVTLCDISCVTEIDDRNPRIASFKTKLRKGIRGLSFIGTIEPGYYTNIQAGAQVAHKKCVSWHLHVLVWGIEEKVLRSLIRGLNRSGKYRAIAPDKRGADCRKVKKHQLPEVLGYVLKPPTVAYRVSIRARGPVGASSKQGKSLLRHGERLNLFHAMKELTLPDLALAGGEGVDLLAEIKKAAWKACGRPR
jgi:hypothetical protein